MKENQNIPMSMTPIPETGTPKQKKEEFTKGMTFSLCLLIFYAATTFFIRQIAQEDIHQNIDRSQFQELNAMGEKIHDVLTRIEMHLVHVSTLYTVKKILKEENPKIREEVESLFSKIIEVGVKNLSPTFDQVRLLDLTGKEKIRVDLDKNNEIKVCSQDQLQDKSSRYYFKESIGLSKNQFYISPMDLNIEHGGIEIPHKPMIRFAAPVFDHGGKKIGLLIFNYNAQQMIDSIAGGNIHENDQWFLLNSDGYYLHGPVPNKNFGFMFPGKKVGFFSDYPNLWTKISTTNNKKFIQSNGIYYLKNITPFKVDRLLINSQIHQWTILMFVPQENIKKQNELLNRSFFWVSGFIAPILMIMGWLLGKSRVKNKYYIKALEKSAKRDGMTGLFNHREILEKLRYQTKVCKRSSQPLSLAYIDLNGLKAINDTLGHKRGDQLITAAADAVKGSIRDTDIAARIGGDEFLIIFPNMKKANVRETLGRIERSYAGRTQTLFQDKQTLSWGVSFWEGVFDTPEDMISRANIEMYQMKKSKQPTGIDP